MINLSFASHPKINLGSFEFVGDSVRFTPAKESSFYVPRSTRRDLVRAAEYLFKEKAAVSCDCHGYTLTKLD